MTTEILPIFGPVLDVEISAAALLLALFFGTFISEDLACLAAGTLAADGRIDIASAIGACFLGIFVGDMLLYGAGRVFGGRVVRMRAFSRFVSEERLERGAEWLDKRGASAVFLSRFVTGLRLPTYLAAGALRTDFKKFAFYFAIATAVWTPLLVGAAALWQMAIPGNFLIGIVAVFVSVRATIKLFNWKTRRIVWGNFLRILKWEFWPLQVFYLPVVCYVGVLAIRHRSLTVFTAANPGILAGGFVGESKDRIYEMIRGSEAASPYMLRHKLISSCESASERLRAAADFLAEHDLSFPVVLKPDKGERGKGVTIVHSNEALRNAIVSSVEDVIVQEFFGGVEASVFYYRRAGEVNGEIFSITEKRFPFVTGDGEADLETLILRDPRAFLLARKYFERNAERIKYVPAPGEKVELIDIGTHSRGAVFLDGGRLKTPELESKIDEICLGIEGFYFGRFDIRARSFEDLMRGEDFRIIELNGVTSESTNIYDPRYGLRDAYRILFAQWRLAFEIGAANVKLGAEAASAGKLVRLLVGK